MEKEYYPLHKQGTLEYKVYLQFFEIFSTLSAPYGPKDMVIMHKHKF